MDEIKEGCVVSLGADIYAPHMTVGKITKGEARCYWFKDKELKQALLPVAALRFVKE